jgi:hypothetical protein
MASGWPTPTARSGPRKSSAAKAPRRLLPSHQQRTTPRRKVDKPCPLSRDSGYGQEPVRLAQPPPTVMPPPTGVFGEVF